MYPSKFEKMISIYKKLPGVGEKTAQRYAFSLLDVSKEELDDYIDALKGIKELKRCKVCGFLSDTDTCDICADKNRNSRKIMVVAYPQDLIAIEKIGTYDGQYHVLGGLISASKGIYPEDLGIDALIERVDQGADEIILATSATIDGEMTALYLDKVLKNRNVLVTRLAHGLPMGASLDYADELTLIKALDNRRKIEE